MTRADIDYSSLSNDKWIDGNIKYIVLKKEGSLKPNCWIKVNVALYNSMNLVVLILKM